MSGYISLRGSEENDRCAIGVGSDCSSTPRNEIVITGHKVFGLRIETIWRLLGAAVSIIALTLTMIVFARTTLPPAMPAFLVSLVALGLNASPIGFWALRRLITSTDICEDCKERVWDRVASARTGAGGVLHAGVALLSLLHGILVITLRQRWRSSRAFDNAAGAMLILLSFIHAVHVFFGLTFKHRIEIKLVPVKSGLASRSVRSYSALSTYQDVANAPDARLLDPETSHATEAKV